jgi:GT2 family glycosyltransferase
MGADYAVISNDDIELDRGTLDMLAMPDAVVSPMVNNGVFKVFHAHIFCLPKTVWEKIGPFDERFEAYWADTDYAKRMKDAGIDVHINPEVNVKHPEAARTLKHFKGSTEKPDEAKFREKWGRTWFDPTTGV